MKPILDISDALFFHKRHGMDSELSPFIFGRVPAPESHTPYKLVPCWLEFIHGPLPIVSELLAKFQKPLQHQTLERWMELPLLPTVYIQHIPYFFRKAHPQQFDGEYRLGLAPVDRGWLWTLLPSNKI